MSDVYESVPNGYVRGLADRVNKALTEGQSVVNVDNMAKFNAVYDFFCWFAEDNGVEIEKVDVNPQSAQASLSIEVPNVDLHGAGITRFVDVMQYIDVLNVRQTEAGNLMIEVCVNNTWNVQEE